MHQHHHSILEWLHISANTILSWREFGSQENSSETLCVRLHYYSMYLRISALIKPTFSLGASLSPLQKTGTVYMPLIHEQEMGRTPR